MSIDNNLCKRIKLLPQELQNMIGEYNVEHREKLKTVNKEYFNIIYNKCMICDLYFSKDSFYSVDYFINYKNKMKYCWCSKECYNKEKILIKNNYEIKINYYLKNISYQYKNKELIL
jgi:hypothetical protein